jgi:hypothetical protein
MRTLLSARSVRRVAARMLIELVTSAFLTLKLLPVRYAIQLRRARALATVGTVPARALR